MGYNDFFFKIKKKRRKKIPKKKGLKFTTFVCLNCSNKFLANRTDPPIKYVHIMYLQFVSKNTVNGYPNENNVRHFRSNQTNPICKCFN
jgi:hypothetical protein